MGERETPISLESLEVELLTQVKKLLYLGSRKQTNCFLIKPHTHRRIYTWISISECGCVGKALLKWRTTLKAVKNVNLIQHPDAVHP